MKKKNSKWTGTGGVFQFTYSQAMKSKAMIITLTIFCIVALLSFPLITLFSGDADSESLIEVENIYIYEENISISSTVIDMMSKEESFKDTKFVVVEKTQMEDIKANDITKAEVKDVILSILCVSDVNSEDFGITYELYFSEESGMTKSVVEEIAAYLSNNISLMTYIHVGIDKEVADMLTESISYNTFLLDENGNVVSDGISEEQYNINYALLMIVLLAITFSSSYVAGQIVTEKSSKVVEYLLTSIKPMAIITGKVLGAVAIVFTLLGAVTASFVVSGVINGIMNMENAGGFKLPAILSDIANSEVMAGMTPITILLALAVFVIGFIFYCFLGGVSGAMVSKVEELAEGTKLITFATVIGAYLSLALIMASSLGGAGWGSLNYLVYFLPLSAPFIVPSYLLFGIISPLVGLAVVVVNIVCTIGLVFLVSTIYEQLIYHNGNPLKIKDLFHLSKKKASE